MTSSSIEAADAHSITQAVEWIKVGIGDWESRANAGSKVAGGYRLIFSPRSEHHRGRKLGQEDTRRERHNGDHKSKSLN
jgi:hypothetical protein